MNKLFKLSILFILALRCSITFAAGATGPTGPAGSGYLATSVTSNTIGTGTKTFSTQSGLAYLPNDYVRISANATSYIEGTITSYSGTTLVISEVLKAGTGTFTTWNIGVAGKQGTKGVTGATGANGVSGTNGVTGATGAQGPAGSGGSQWTTSGSNIYYNSGNVGIGTPGPAYQLEVVGFGEGIRNPNSTSYTTLRLQNDLNNTNRQLELDYAGSSYTGTVLNGASSGEAANITTTGAYPLYLGTANTARIAITSSGNVGVGTSSPAYKLDVAGNGRFSNGITGNSTNPYGAAVYGNSSATDHDYGIYGVCNTTSGIALYGQANNGGLAGYFGGNVAMSNNLTINANPATGFLLSVGGGIICTQLEVALQANWPDYVFDKEHTLMPIGELEKQIEKDKHLPGIPSACEVEAKGLNVGDMQAKMMEKIEELTLYVIQLKKDNDSLHGEINSMSTSGNKKNN